MPAGSHQVHVDVAETVGGYWDVLQGYLYMAVNLGPLAAQAGLRPGGDICGETLPNIPGGDEAAGHPPARMGGPEEMFKNLSPKVPGYRRAERAGGGVANEVKVPDLLCDDAQTWTGMESLYLWQRIWRRAISLISRGDLSAMAAQTRAVPAVAAAGWDSTSATTFDVPSTYTSWLVYSEMNARWHCWRPEVGGETLLRAKIKGL
jgi:hypothetical protein